MFSIYMYIPQLSLCLFLAPQIVLPISCILKVLRFLRVYEDEQSGFSLNLKETVFARETRFNCSFEDLKSINVTRPKVSDIYVTS